MKTIRENNGMTLLISIVTTSLLLLVSFVVVNIALKQLVISFSNVESQYAFYNADSGIECAVYWDLKNPTNPGTSAFDPATASTINCNGQVITSGQVVPTSPVPTASIVGGGGAVLTSIFSVNFPKGCAIVQVTKLINGDTQIDSRGYNNCNVGADRRFERGETLNY